MDAVLEEICQAYLVEGPHPAYHRRIVQQLAEEWPTMYYAVLKACRVKGHLK